MQLICAGDAELNRIVIKGLKDYASLGETEKPQFIETAAVVGSLEVRVTSSNNEEPILMADEEPE